ncbi:MAG: hypothetical protein KDE55_12650 [Novosphingobium sp.]|nr:hypothetical protein [Novosphingobium sp.]
MTGTTAEFPKFPPGLWRRIVLDPHPHWIGAALEDDLHRFNLRIDHSDGCIARVTAQALRTPWTECGGAAGFIAAELTGELLEDVARRDPYQHCTHLLDLAILASAHAGDTAQTTFDMRVADRVDERTTATFSRDGEEMLRWQLDGTLVVGGPQDGLNLRKLSQWKSELPAEEAEQATVLRRAIYISGGRQFTPPPGLHAVDMGPQRMGVCFNYQLPQAESSTRTEGWRKDFSESGDTPLADFNPDGAFAEMA